MAAAAIQLVIAHDHPAFRGHFPGRPILPAVVLLAEALAAVEASSGRGAEAWIVSSAKFVEPVAPGATLTLSQETLASGAIRFEIRGEAGIVAHGTLSPRV
jgi:3-hydroxymyristoyl/3-hydroxydecanoyl-(acyl carrier protein) dehydratase